MESYRAQEERRALVRAMLIKEVSSRYGVSPAEIVAYYEGTRRSSRRARGST